VLGRVHHVDLYPQVVAQKVSRVRAVGQDAANTACCIDDDIGPLPLEKRARGFAIPQVKLRGGGPDERGETLRLKVAPDGRTHQATMASNVDLRASVELKIHRFPSKSTPRYRTDSSSAHLSPAVTTADDRLGLKLSWPLTPGPGQNTAA